MSTRLQLLALVLVGLGLAAATSGLRRNFATPPSDGLQRYWYCPDCGLELAIPAETEPKQSFCPHCGPNRPMQVSGQSRAETQAAGRPINLWFVGTMFAVPAALAVGLFVISRSRSNPHAEAEERSEFRFACPGCGHVIESSAYRPGSTAVCPACAQMFVVAGADSASDRPDAEASASKPPIRILPRDRPSTKRKRRDS